MKNKRPKLDEVNSTLIGVTSGRRKVFIPDDCKHVLMCGTTGAGKTVALSNFVANAVEKDYGTVSHY